MDCKLMWMIKSGRISHTRKNLSDLAEREDLFDESSIDKDSEEYKDAEKNLSLAKEHSCRVITYIDDSYPDVLRNIPQPPAVLYVKGDYKILKNTVFAGIVGARNSDMYGIRIAETVASEIGQTGAGIVSGGAKGIDSAAHRGALRVKAPTVAVLGCGIDICYPPQNKELFESIVNSGGAIVSEFPFGTQPGKKNFPRRNRIISALSTALVVVRAAYKSGSLITASQAMDMGVSVFSVPGNIDENLSRGTNELIRDGATPLLSAMDVIDELIAQKPDFFVMEKKKKEKPEFKETAEEEKNEKQVNTGGLSEYEAEIVNIINKGFQTQNLIEEKVSFPPARLTALLGMMEIKGIIRKGHDKKYTIT